MAAPKTVQMIDGEGNFRYPETERFVQELPPSSPYTVISIFGPQCSGKSYLLNKLFDTPFEVSSAHDRRQQTAKGIWIAKSSGPCMIIMDVVGMDEKERKEDALFGRQSALFSLAISNVMLLNMWYRDIVRQQSAGLDLLKLIFHDIGRQQGADLDLLKLIFQERVKMEAPSTEIIIVVRDHDYYQVDANVTSENLKRAVTELWQEVHPNTSLSDYIRVTVKVFPHHIAAKEKFAEKCQDLQNLLRATAADGTVQQMSYAPSFAYRSKMIWDKILKSERLTADDEKLAMSNHVCHVVMNNTINLLDKEQEYEALMSVTTIKEFNAMLKSFLSRLLARYDNETKAFNATIRNATKAILQQRIVNRFKGTFNNMAGELVNMLLSEAESKLPDDFKRLGKWDASALSEVRLDYLKSFDVASLGDVQTNFEDIRSKHRDDFERRLKSIAEIKASEIRIAASTSECPEVMERMLKSLSKEKEYPLLMSVTTPLNVFNGMLVLLLQKMLARYEEETSIYDAGIRNEIKAKLESKIVHTFRCTFDEKAEKLFNTMLPDARTEITAKLKYLDGLEETDRKTVLKDYMKKFEDDIFKGIHEELLDPLKACRQRFEIQLDKFAETTANDMKKTRFLMKGAKVAYAGFGALRVIMGDPTAMAEGIAALIATDPSVLTIATSAINFMVDPFLTETVANAAQTIISDPSLVETAANSAINFIVDPSLAETTADAAQTFIDNQSLAETDANGAKAFIASQAETATNVASVENSNFEVLKPKDRNSRMNSGDEACSKTATDQKVFEKPKKRPI